VLLVLTENFPRKKKRKNMLGILSCKLSFHRIIKLLGENNSKGRRRRRRRRRSRSIKPMIRILPLDFQVLPTWDGHMGGRSSDPLVQS